MKCRAESLNKESGRAKIIINNNIIEQADMLNFICFTTIEEVIIIWEV
jgi:hypothetical protein